MLGATPWEVVKLCDSGELEHGHIGRRIVIRPESVRRFAAEVTA
jgi:hypothetical protein